jgi:hypothetical protein
MFQIVEAFVNTVTHLIDAHGLKLVIGAVALVVVWIVLRILRRVVVGSSSQQRQ